MFYIDRLWRRQKKDIVAMHVAPAVVVFVAFFSLTLWTYMTANRAIEEKRHTVLNQDIEQTQSTIQRRWTAYEDILRAGVGLFGASDVVTRQEWKDFIEEFELSRRYPGLQAVGFIEMVKQENLAAHIQALQAQGSSNYAVKPGGDRDMYGNVVYIEPMDSQHQQVIGYDMYTDSVMRTAMDISRDANQITLSDVVPASSTTIAPSQPELRMFIPMYKRGSTSQNPTQARENLSGFVFASFAPKQVMSDLFSQDDKSYFGFVVYEGPRQDSNILYKTPSYEKVAAGSGVRVSSTSFSVNNQLWTIAGVVDDTVIPTRERSRPASVFWGGLLFSLFVAGFIYMLLLNRSRVLSRKDELDMRDAKDELLALASHQLRTPATGVKQYLGMMREGFVGSLTPQQKTYLNKAYDSNERQLGIINEMLLVARADAGNIDLAKIEFDVKPIIDEILDEQANDIRRRKQTVHVDTPDGAVMAYGDPNYLRMAIENIISNAVKYTMNQGLINIVVTTHKRSVQVVVHDTGVGVGQKDLPLLFQKFSRIPNELTNQVSGSGVGLYLVQKIMGAHNGNVTFTSVQGQGSTCKIVIPNKTTRDV